MPAETRIFHATSVALQDRGVLIMGQSGSGKSALGLTLLSLGCALVADDRTIVTKDGNLLKASCPDAITGLIEARFVGLLRAVAVPAVDLCLAVNLDVTESVRMPPERHFEVFGCKLPLFHNVETPYFAAAILQYLKAGPRLP